MFYSIILIQSYIQRAVSLRQQKLYDIFLNKHWYVFDLWTSLKLCSVHQNKLVEEVSCATL